MDLKIMVYAFEYTPCIYESAYSTVSIHRTKKGAYKAMNKYLNDRFNEAREERLKFGNHITYD